ncbi:MAG: peptidylprolyl isomerase [Bacteroidales bacterium]|jgi:FKBP-type peptidyl-prolyl cis-trans isomerase SlyD|nr:peptidylprolyl isomerase [Bacteroidales bacterium]HNT41608.1 peptidylprolyl isomerase [Tenuifilaceae bacterium]MBP8643078.1 peptidylprolyl isomerase [Bacteroidales bacterium]NLI88070.1 peptidylprolyl isomerase [Bacteroidales bacterium]HOA09317.1 peptidylprolyl isomerase [Tenuifilaceae bacterium]
MNISNDKVVSISYELKVNGDLVDSAVADNPLVFLYGHGQLLPLFETNIHNLKTGDSFEFSIPYADGYGEVDEEAIIDLPKDIFVIDGVLQEDMLVVGNTLPLRDSEGNELNGTILEVGDTHVRMDFNHPLAGEDLYFTGKIIDVREATSEELSHGHVHAHGHH